MKLKNKKTGKIGYTAVLQSKAIFVMDENAIQLGSYTSLAELNAEWKDYEEPKEYWYIEPDGSIIQNHKPTYINHLLDGLKSIGNYFQTKEEAEKAVEKLKVWKWLKDKGIRVVGWDYSVNVDLNGCKFNDDDFIVGLSAGDIDEEDLDLLFGGEE